MNKQVQTLIKKVDRSRCSNNTQRALLALLTAKTEWVALNTVRVPSAAARIRDLRKSDFGSFKVEVRRGTEMPTKTSANRTFYRIDPASVTVQRVRRVLEGVIS